MITISEERLVSVITGEMPDPDSVGPYNPRAFLHQALGAVTAEPDPSPWRHASEPDPLPWRQFAAVAGILKTAALAEVGASGAGLRALGAVLDDPEDWCPTRPRPHVPHGPHHLDDVDLIILGAAFFSLSAGVANADVAELARKGGAALMARGAGA